MKESIRQCIACRDKHPKAMLLRVIKTPEGRIFFDEKHQMNGRSVYFCREPKCVQKAQKKDLVSQTFQIKISTDIYTKLACQTQSKSQDSIESLLGFAARARKLVIGMTAVSQAMRKKNTHLVVLDRETSPSTRKKIEGLSQSSGIPFYTYEEKPLEQIVGKVNCKCVAVIDSEFAQSIRKAMQS